MLCEMSTLDISSSFVRKIMLGVAICCNKIGNTSLSISAPWSSSKEISRSGSRLNFSLTIKNKTKVREYNYEQYFPRITRIHLPFCKKVSKSAVEMISFFPRYRLETLINFSIFAILVGLFTGNLFLRLGLMLYLYLRGKNLYGAVLLLLHINCNLLLKQN